MPIYEFHCANCSKDGEVLVRATDWKDSECPHCGSKKLTKKLSTFASSVAGAKPSGGACAVGKPARGCGCRGGKHNH